jgi:hypothetical protein
MRKIPLPLLIAAVFLTTVAIYLTFTVNTSAPPVWTSTANTTLTFVTPQTYFVYGSEFNRITDGRSGATVSVLGSRTAQITISNTQSVPWFIVGESQISGTVYTSSGISEGSVTWNIPMVLAMGYNESMIANMYGTNPICVTLNKTSVTLQVNPTGAPGYIALGWKFSTSYGNTAVAEVEYYYIGKVVTPNGFTWYMYLAAPVAGAATGKITLSSFGCVSTSTYLYYSYGEFTGWSTSGYLAQVTITPIVRGSWTGTYSFTQVANVTASTTPTTMPAGSGSTIYGPDGMTIGVALPMEAYAFPVNNGPVLIFYSP